MFRCSYPLQQLIHSPGTAANDDKFGISLAIGSVGGYMVVGEKGTNKAYVFVEDGDTWSNTDTLVASTDKFAQNVAVYDETIVVSNHKYDVSSDKGHAFVYKLVSGKTLINPML